MDGMNWRTSSFSGNGGGNCVAVANDSGGVYVRNSNDPDGPMVKFTREEWRKFLLGANNHEFDLP